MPPLIFSSSECLRLYISVSLGVRVHLHVHHSFLLTGEAAGNCPNGDELLHCLKNRL